MKLPPFSFRSIGLAAALAFACGGVSAEEHSHAAWETCAAKAQLFRSAAIQSDARGEEKGPKYAPDREIDVLHLKLDITPDYEARTIQGISEIRFTPIAKPLRVLRLDAVDLHVASVKASREIEEHYPAMEQLVVTFAEPIPPGEECTVTIAYSCEPEQGLYFRTEAMGYPKGDDHFWTQGEPQRHRYWFPGYDYPNERFTTEVVCHVPEGMTVLSNGRLLSEKKDEATGLVSFHWLQDKPHVNYLISIVAGYLKALEDDYRGMPLAFYTPPSEFAEAANSFRDTKQILTFFEKEIGVDYPWDKYFNVCVHDFVAGGMENTSVTTLTTNTLFSTASENLHTSHHLDAHETAHQWFGDLVTCKDWSQIWLNEGFATYYTHLYEEEKNGVESMRYEMFSDARRVIGAKDDKPITWRGYTDPWQQFDHRAYPKGSWVLHMLRSQLGPDLYRDCIRTYLERHRNQNVETADLRIIIEELSGRNWEKFFDQWVHKGGTPELKITYAWDQAAKQARLTVAQTQKVTEKVPLFDFPLPVRFTVGKDKHDFQVRVHDAGEDFYFDLPGKPEVVRIDPEYTLLSDIKIDLPPPMLFAQLEDPEDMMGRLLAVEKLGGRKDRQSVEKLKAVLKGDSFYGVRIEAAQALAKTHSEEALDALLASRDQTDARVRDEVVESIGKFYREPALGALREVVANEQNPDIVASALSATGKFPDEEIDDILQQALDRESYRHRIASAAIEAMRDQDEPRLAGVLIGHVRENEASFTTWNLGKALDTIAYLARNEEDGAREPVKDFLAGYLTHPKEGLRTGAIRALGTLEDPRAIALLDTFVSTGNQDSPEHRAADEALKKLRGDQPQSQELRDLRGEVMDLRKTLGQLQEQLTTLQKKNEPPKPAGEKSGGKAPGDDAAAPPAAAGGN